MGLPLCAADGVCLEEFALWVYGASARTAVPSAAPSELRHGVYGTAPERFRALCGQASGGRLAVDRARDVAAAHALSTADVDAVVAGVVALDADTDGVVDLYDFMG